MTIFYYNYFNILTFPDNSISITFLDYINDIIYDDSHTIIPFTDGKYYLLYQDICFKILKLLESMNISTNIHIKEMSGYPIIYILSNIDINELIVIITPIINNSINKKFSLIM